MSTRTAKVFTYQEDVESADLNKYPQGWLARVRVTGTNQSTIASETILTAFTETATAQGTDRMLKCEAMVNTTATHLTLEAIYGIVRIRSGGLGGTVVAYTAFMFGDSTGPSAETNYHTVYAVGTDSLVNGSVTYYVTLQLLSGVATLGTDHSTSRPGMLLVSDIGPT